MRCPSCRKHIIGTPSSCPKCGKALGILGAAMGRPPKAKKQLHPGPALVAVAVILNAGMLLALLVRLASLNITLQLPTQSTQANHTAASTLPHTQIELPTVPSIPTTAPQPSSPPYETAFSHIPASHTISLRKVSISGKRKMVVYYDDQPVETFDRLSSQIQHQTSFDGGTAVFTLNGNMYYVVNAKCLLIANGVEEFMLSTDGNGILYLVAPTAYSEQYQLYLYSQGMNQLLASFYNRNELMQMVISPDGSSVAYVHNHVLFCYVNSGDEASQIHMLSASLEGEELVAISNNCNYIYTASQGESTQLYCYTPQGSKTELGSVDAFTGLLFNAYNTEVLFHCDNKTFLSVNGQPGQFLAEGYLYPMLPAHTNTILLSSRWFIYEDTTPTLDDIDYPNTDTEYQPATRNDTGYPFYSFYGLAYTQADDENSIWFLSENQKLLILSVPYTQALIDSSGQFLYYISDGTLYYQQISQPESDRILIAENVSNESLSFDATGQFCYFVTSEDQRYCYDRVTDQISLISFIYGAE